VTTPAGYPYAQVRELWGGVRDDIQNNVVAVDLAALTGAQSAAEGGEDRRRQLASQRPGHGAALPLPSPPSGISTGKPEVGGLPVGEGYAVTADIVPAVHKSYGPGRPVYADDLVSGYGFQGGRGEQAISMYIGSRSASADSPFTVVSAGGPQGSLWSRMKARMRRR
jgi:hypothetical protein